jgi:TolB-like protein
MINQKIFLLILLLFLLISGLYKPLYAQVNIAVSGFTNKSNEMYLDAWERSVPDLLRTYLSANNDVAVLSRDRLETVLQEQSLSMSGLIDSSQVQSIGKLLGAEFILSGSIDQQNGDYVISADLIRVKTGQIQTEIVRSANRDFQDQMVEMLAGNLLYKLTSTGEYKQQMSFKSNSTWYLTGTTLLLGGITLLTNNYYNDNLEKYRKATRLKDFDTYYDKANTSKNLVTGFAVAAGVAAIWTIIDLIHGDEANTIQSGRKSHSLINSNIYFAGNNEIKVGLQIHF